MKKKNQGDSTSMKLIGIKSVDEAFKVSLGRVVIKIVEIMAGYLSKSYQT